VFDSIQVDRKDVAQSTGPKIFPRQNPGEQTKAGKGGEGGTSFTLFFRPPQGLTARRNMVKPVCMPRTSRYRRLSSLTLFSLLNEKRPMPGSFFMVD
jgi:hypothetical protein